jgi:hypothetical protein
MIKNGLILFIALASFGVNGQFYISKNAKITLESDVVLTSNQDIINNGEVTGRGNLLLERLVNNGKIDIYSIITGRNKGYLGGRSQINTNKLLISSDVFLETDLELKDILDFNYSGRIFTNENKVIFRDAANYQNLTDETYIDGNIRKYGYSEFVFPLGIQHRLRPIIIESNDNKFSSLDIGIANFSSFDKFKKKDSGESINYYYTLTKPNLKLIEDITIKETLVPSKSESLFLNEDNQWINKIVLNNDRNIIITKGKLDKFIDFNEKELDVNVFPNPSNGKINITSSHKDVNLKVYDQMGRVELELGNILNQSQVILPQKLMNKPIILRFESKGKYKTIKHIYTNQIIYDEK